MNRGKEIPAKYPVLCAFFCSAFFFLLLMLLLRIAPFGERTFLYDDMKRQYVAFFAHYREVFHSGENFLYSFRKGLGGGAIGFFAYYLTSPLLLPFSFLPAESYPVAVSVLLLVKLSLCAASCCAFLKCFCPIRPEFPARTAFLILSSLTWSFSAYLISNLSNTMWLDAVILMPILYLSAVKLMQGAPMWKHAILVAAILCVNYYIAYMSLLFEGIAVLVYLNRERLRSLPRYIASVLLGAGVGAALLLPTFLALSGTSKDSLQLGLRMLTPPPIWGQILARLYSLSYDESQIFDGAPPIGAGVLILLPAVLFYLSRNRRVGEKIRMAILWLVMLVSFRLPFLNLLWHAGTEPRGYLFRNAFLFVFLMLCCFCLALTDLSEGGLGRREVLIAAIGVGILTAVVFCGQYSYLGTRKKIWNALFLIAGAVLLWLIAERERSSAGVRLLLICFFLLQTGDLLVGARQIYLQNSFYATKRSDFVAKYGQARDAAQRIPQDGELFRTESLTPIEQNDAMLIGYPGVTYYGSDVQLSERLFLKRLGYNDNELYAEYESGNTRTAEALLGIRYLIDGERIEERDAFPMIVDLAAEGEEPDLAGKDPFAYAQVMVSVLTGDHAEVFRPAEVREDRTETAEGERRITYTLYPQKDGELYFYLADTEYPQNLILKTEEGEEIPYGNDADLCVVDLGEHRAGEEVSLGIEVYDRAFSGRAIFVTEDKEVLREALREVRDRGGGIRQLTSSHLRAEVPSGSASAALLIPYDEAWRITLHGQRLETEPLGDLYMRVLLPDGADAEPMLTLDLTYHPRGLIPGIVISGISVVIILVLCYHEIAKEKDQKRKSL